MIAATKVRPASCGDLSRRSFGGGGSEVVIACKDGFDDVTDGDGPNGDYDGDGDNQITAMAATLTETVTMIRMMTRVQVMWMRREMMGMVTSKTTTTMWC